MNDSENMCSHSINRLLKRDLIYHLKTSLYLQLIYFG